MPKPSGWTDASKIAAAVLALALLAWFWTWDRPLLRVAPADFPCWQDGLRVQAGLYADQTELLGFADQSAAALESWVTRGRRIEVQGAAWQALFRQVRSAHGHACRDLESKDICRRASPREQDWLNGFFYAPDEAPFSGLGPLPSDGEAVYLYLEDAEPLQLLSVPAGQTEGKVHGCRWYYGGWQIPTDFAHPARRYSYWLFGLGLLVLLWKPVGRALATLGSRRDKLDPRLINHRKHSARISLAITLAMLAGLIAPLIVDPDAHYIPPLVFLGGFLSLMGVITTAILWRSALRLDRILHGREVLLRWEYPPDDWHRHVETLFRERSQASGRMLAVIGVIMLVVGGGFVLAMQDAAALFTLGVLAAIFVLLIVVAFWAPRRQRAFLLAHPALVLVARNGVYLAGEFHDFEVMGTRVEGAEVTREAAGSFLRIHYSYQSRNGRQHTQVAIPVPAGHDDAAHRAADELNRGGAS